MGFGFQGCKCIKGLWRFEGFGLVESKRFRAFELYIYRVWDGRALILGAGLLSFWGCFSCKLLSSGTNPKH